MTKMNSSVVRSVDDLPQAHWLARQLPAGTSLRGFAEERAILAGARVVEQAIAAAQLSRTDLAELLGTSRSYITQVLNGSANMTLKTLGALLWACGQEVEAVSMRALGYLRSAGMNIDAGGANACVGSYPSSLEIRALQEQARVQTVVDVDGGDASESWQGTARSGTALQAAAVGNDNLALAA